jgi:hypothetical protein
MKVILKLRVMDMTTVGDLASGSVQLQIYDRTRSMMIADQTIDVSALLQDFKTQSLAGATGTGAEYKSVQIYGLSNYATNFDCVWVFRLSSPDERVHVSTNSLQKLYFIAE